MNTLKSILMIVLAITMIPGSARVSAAIDYACLTALTTAPIPVAQSTVQWGLMNAFDAIGLHRYGYWHCGPADLIEDSFLLAPLDARRQDCARSRL